MHPASGLLPKEQAVMDHLVEATNEFARLPRTHPSDMEEFIDGMHRCQQLLAMRIVRRLYAGVWFSE